MSIPSNGNVPKKTRGPIKPLTPTSVAVRSMMLLDRLPIEQRAEAVKKIQALLA